MLCAEHDTWSTLGRRTSRYHDIAYDSAWGRQERTYGVKKVANLGTRSGHGGMVGNVTNGKVQEKLDFISVTPLCQVIDGAEHKRTSTKKFTHAATPC